MQSLSALLDPSHRGEAMDAHHRLIWSAFNGGSEERRFIWRQETDGMFFVMSQDAPQGSDLLNIETRPFAPDLSAGDQLSFVLRANATKTVSFPDDIAPNGKPRRRKQDIVMHHIKAQGLQNCDRLGVVQEVSEEWLSAQGDRAGFRPVQMKAENYTTQTVPAARGRRKGRPHFGVIDMSGILEVVDPDAFKASLRDGFGGAKSFGCGMMMVKRS